MAAGSLLALIDDIASVLDDVALMSKVAAKKTAGVLGDDLALNAQQVTGVNADRELPVVWSVAKGSLLNKAINEHLGIKSGSRRAPDAGDNEDALAALDMLGDNVRDALKGKNDG